MTHENWDQPGCLRQEKHTVRQQEKHHMDVTPVYEGKKDTQVSGKPLPAFLLMCANV